MTRRRIAGHKCMVVAILLSGLWGAGCSGFPRVWWPRLPGEGIAVGAVLDYYRKAGTLSPPTITREIERLRVAYRKDPDDDTLFQLVVLAMQRGRSVSERQLALDLLKDFRRRGNGDRDLMVLVSLLEDGLGERAQLAGELDGARKQVRELEATTRELQDKLRALENIEKILRQRESER